MAHPTAIPRSNAAEAAGVVDAGNLMAFADAVTTQVREDLLNSNLLAQLAADKKCSRFTRPIDWYRYYGDTLSALAWQVSGMNFSRYVPAGLQFNTREIVLAEMAKVETPAHVRQVREAIDALDGLPEDARAREVFRAFSAKEHALNLQVSFGATGAAGRIVCVVFSTEEDIVDPLVQTFEVSALTTDIRIAVLSGELNEQIYPMLRQSVIDKLGDRRDELIVPVEPQTSGSPVA